MAQLFYDGIEQFYCQADSCTQNLNSTVGGSDWECSNLRCTCRPGTSFCGGGVTNLTATINTLGGTLGIVCQPVDNTTHQASCNFVQSTLQSLFGNQGLSLSGCTFGECVRQNVIDSGGGNTAPKEDTSKSLSGGVIAGLAVVGALVGLSLVLLGIGHLAQKRARRNPTAVEKHRASLEWSNLSYIIPGTYSTFLSGLRSRRRVATDINEDKVILDNVNGAVRPGQMMAILGPSGKHSFKACQNNL